MTKKSYLLFLILALLMCSCYNKSSEENPDSMNGEKMMKEEETIEVELVSKERLLVFIQTNDIGLPIDFFEVVDIDEFISGNHLTEENMEEFIVWLVSSGFYLIELDDWRKTNYIAREKISVDSTDEEYREFINKFSQAIDIKIKTPSTHYEFSSSFDIENDNGDTDLYIERTKDINKFEVRETTTYPRILEIAVVVKEEGKYTKTFDFCYSKNKKYILLATPHDERHLEYIKIFQEIDD